MTSARVLIILGSPADGEWGKKISRRLADFGIDSDTRIASAHKTPTRVLTILEEWERRADPVVYITVAGRSNALSGFVDAQVANPVIACPPPSDSFGGMDVLSSLRMPRGVAPMVVLEAENAALAAAKILGVASAQIRERVASSQTEERDRLVAADAPVEVNT
jgi:5-(carboxyamino)imidazole ribonucleotide mutase